jgi:hypothetical protein
MEHREPPRIGPSHREFDASLEAPAGRFRLRPLIAAPHGRRLDSVKMGIVLLIGLTVTAALILLGSWATRVTLDWLADQAPYQLPFSRIHLVNEPPRWFRGGAQAVLEGVRKSSGEAETISLLQVPPERLAMSFKKYAWVEWVKVSYSPGAIDVELRYHRPVAWVQLQGAEQIVIDEKGNVLPAEDIDVSQLGRVIKITGAGLAAPSDRRPGVVWKVRDGNGFERVDERILAAAKSANYLLEEPQYGDAQRSDALRILEIIVTDFSSRGLFLLNAEGIEILWGQAPGDEPSGKPAAPEKWAMLRRWQETEKARYVAEGDFWAFSKDRLRHVCPPTHPRHEPLKESPSK